MAHYICTNCTAPTPTLYKIYSTPGSVQLTSCKNCSHDVDPYIEREWLLVLMDCVLHRPEAFRHVLYNREPFCNVIDVVDDTDTVSVSGGTVPTTEGSSEMENDSSQRNQSGDGGDKDSSASASDMNRSNAARSISNQHQPTADSRNNQHLRRRLIRYSIMASLLRTYVWYISQGPDRNDHETMNMIIMPELILVFLQSIIGDVILVATTIFMAQQQATTMQAKQTDSNTAKISNDSQDYNSKTLFFFYSRIHLALTIPIFFHIGTLFALIWENSTTVTLLGTFFVVSLQCRGVSIVMEERRVGMGMCQQNNDVAENQDSTTSTTHSDEQQSSLLLGHLLPHSFPFIVGLMVRTLAIHAASRLLASFIVDGNDLSCSGIMLPDSFGTGGDICIV